MTGRRALDRVVRGAARIGVRLLLFNVLLVFLPVAGLASLDAYEQHLLDQQERAMVQHGRLAAAMIGNGAVIDGPAAQRVLDRLERSVDMRVRVLDATGRILADSHRVPAADEPAAATYPAGDRVARALRSTFLYRAGAWLGRAWRRLTEGPRAPAAGGIAVTPEGRLEAREVMRALAGQYGAATRPSPGGQRSLTLYGALPVWHDSRVIGAVVVSQSTWRILQRLYDVRIRMFEVVVISLVAAAVLSFIAATTIVRPLAHLRADAAALVNRAARQAPRFRGTRRRDEIGDLARALDEITGRLEAHIRFTEQFAADVTHEFRNPLAAIRASTEMLAEADDPEDRARFRQRIDRDIRRLEALLARVREITAIDAGLEADPTAPIDLVAVVREIVAARDATGSRPPLHLVHPGGPLLVRASAERLAQVVTNLLDNAESFSPPGEAVAVELSRDANRIRLLVSDRGPGIPAAHAERVFDRFFTHRPGQAQAREAHAGLGLSIARTIVDSYGGTISVVPSDVGARFEVALPRLDS